MADVMPCGLQADGMPWQMLLPYHVVVDDKTTDSPISIKNIWREVQRTSKGPFPNI